MKPLSSKGVSEYSVSPSRGDTTFRRKSTTKLRGRYGAKKDWRDWRTDQSRNATWKERRRWKPELALRCPEEKK